MATNYQCNEYSSNVIKGFNDLREENLFCDAILESSDGQQFPVHRCLLITTSSYFKAMFAGGFKEASQGLEQPVVLENVSSTCLSSLLNFLYSGKLKLTNKIVHEVLSAAHMMQPKLVVDACTEHMIKRMSTVTCFRNIEIAEGLELDAVKRAADNFILSNFVALSRTKEFRELPVSKLCRYLSDDRLEGEEVSIFWAAMEWIE